MIADTPTIDGARIVGAIVSVVAVFGGFTCKCAFAHNADTERTQRTELASAAVFDWPALANALGTRVLRARVPVVAIFGALAFGHAAAPAIAARAAVAACTAIPTAAGRLASDGERQHAHQSEQVPHRKPPRFERPKR